MITDEGVSFLLSVQTALLAEAAASKNARTMEGVLWYAKAMHDAQVVAHCLPNHSSSDSTWGYVHDYLRYVVMGTKYEWIVKILE